MKQKVEGAGSRTVLCPGSFDPVTNGHLDVIYRAAQLFDQVVVVVAVNPEKKYRFNVEERMAFIMSGLKTFPASKQKKITGFSLTDLGSGKQTKNSETASKAPLGKITVTATDGLLVDLAKEVGAVALVKGVRDYADWQSELGQSQANQYLGGIETVFIPTDPRWSFVSSSLVKELAKHGRSVASLVPDGVAQALDALSR